MHHLFAFASRSTDLDDFRVVSKTVGPVSNQALALGAEVPAPTASMSFGRSLPAVPVPGLARGGLQQARFDRRGGRGRRRQRPVYRHVSRLARRVRHAGGVQRHHAGCRRATRIPDGGPTDHGDQCRYAVRERIHRDQASTNRVPFRVSRARSCTRRSGSPFRSSPPIIFAFNVCLHQSQLVARSSTRVPTSPRSSTCSATRIRSRCLRATPGALAESCRVHVRVTSWRGRKRRGSGPCYTSSRTWRTRTWSGDGDCDSSSRRIAHHSPATTRMRGRPDSATPTPILASRSQCFRSYERRTSG